MTGHAPRNITELVTRVLDQLSLSSWLPALTLVAGTTTTAEMVRLRTTDPIRALAAVSDTSLGGFVTLAAAVLVAALLTQAFAFQTVRLLEGCWGTGPVTERLVARSIARADRRRSRLQAAALEAEIEGHAEAMAELRRRGTRCDFVHALEHGFDAQDIDPALVPSLLAYDWTDDASPRTRRRIDQLHAEVDAYPTGNRLLPTTLGNVLRSYEERTAAATIGTDAWILRHADEVPARLRTEHDQARSRLDLYGTLQPVVWFLVALSLTALPATELGLLPGALAIATVEGAIAVLCHRATLASAHRYGQVLLAIDEAVSATVDLSERPEGDPGGEADHELTVLPPTGPGATGTDDGFDPWDELHSGDTLPRR